MLGAVIQLFKGRPRRFHGRCQKCGESDYLPWATEHGVRYCGHCWERDALAFASSARIENGGDMPRRSLVAQLVDQIRRRRLSS